MVMTALMHRKKISIGIMIMDYWMDSVLLTFGAEMVGNSPLMRTKGQIVGDLI